MVTREPPESAATADAVGTEAWEHRNRDWADGRKFNLVDTDDDVQP